MISSSSPWYVVQTKPRQEKIACENLLRQGYGAYLPQLKVVKRIRRSQQVRLEPMFPRYLFFRPCSANQSIGPARSTIGVVNIVSFGHAPALMRESVIEAIQALESRQNEASMEELSPILPGRKVLVVDGPLAGLEGLVSSVSAQRVDVLMHLLGTDARVNIDRNCLELVV